MAFATKLPGPERPTVIAFLREANPDKPWHCAGADFVFRIYQPRKHPPVSDAPVLVPEAPLHEDVNHSDREHADLGASSCPRWWNCAGSLNLTRRLNPPRYTNEHAERGTAVHECGHVCLLGGHDAIEMIGRTFNGFEIDEKMAADVQIYLDLCRTFTGDGWEASTERKFNLKKLNPPAPMFGTSDFSAVHRVRRRLKVVDYKNGYLYVSPHTYQLLYYVLGVLCSLPDDVIIEEIEVFIVQPNGDGPAVKSKTYTVMDVFNWHVELLEHARATQMEDAPLKAGEWCKFCPNAGRCPAQAEMAMQTAQMEFTAEPMPGQDVVTYSPPDVRVLTIPQIDAILSRAKLVEDWLDAVKLLAKDMIERGEPGLDNWKIVQGLGHRYWVNSDNAVQTLTTTCRLTEDQIWDKKLKSPAEIERTLLPILRANNIKGEKAKGVLKQILGPLTDRPKTAPRLVHSSDPNPALPARGEEFTAELPPPAAQV